MIGGRMNKTPGEAPYPMYKIKCNHCDAEQWKTSTSNIKCCQEDATSPPGKYTYKRSEDVAKACMRDSLISYNWTWLTNKDGSFIAKP
mmetsp:Transcript_51793/g.52747  ORF Transcript_51793/g.52747 Transcript_51793/m.52747 type:complete len:88 (+) Transcript_51793:136-399(+)